MGSTHCVSPIRRRVRLALAALFAVPAGAAAQVTAAADQQLPPVSVSATRTERPVEDVPGTVTVIDEKTIERNVMKDISDLVRYEPGVSVSNNVGRFGRNSFNIRGIGGNRVLMQVDGIRVPDAFSFGSFSSSSRDVVDIDALKAVEILRGPGSSLYGSDAIAGVVSYITKDPGDYMALTDKPIFASIKGGYASADDSWLSTTTLAAGRGPVQGMVLYTYRAGSETDNKGTVGGAGPSRTEPNPQSYRDGNFLGKLVFVLNPENRFRLTAERLENRTATNVLTLNSQTPRTTGLAGNDDEKRERVSFDHEYKNAGGRLFQLARWQIYYQESHAAQSTFETRANTTAACSGVTVGTNTCVFDRGFDFRQRIYGLNAQLEKLFETGPWSHHLIYGFDYSKMHTSQVRDALRTNVTTGVSTRSVPPDNFPARDFPVSDTTLAGVFIQDELKFGPWSVIPGLRYDYYKLEPLPDFLFTKDNPGITPVEKKEEAWSPKVGVLYRLGPQYTLFGQYAHGFRAPPYNDVNIGFTNLQFGYTAIPNSELKPERSRGVEAGLRGRFAASNFSVAAFYNRYRDFISSLTALNCPGDPRCSTVVPITFQSINLTNVRIYGFEARGEAALGNGFGVIGSFAYAKGEDTDRDQPVNSIEPIKLVTGITYNAPANRYGAQFVGTFVERKHGIDQTTAPVPVASPGFAGSTCWVTGT